MSFVAAKCTQCGASIEIDNSKEAGICPNCGTAFITEKVINNYNTYISNNIVLDGSTAKEFLSNSSSASLNEAEEKCKKLYEFRDFDALEKLASEILEKWPLSYIGYKYSIMGYQIYSRIGTPEHGNMIRKSAKAGAGQDSPHTVQTLLKKMLERMTPEQQQKEKEFIVTIKKQLVLFLTEKIVAMKKRPVPFAVALVVSLIVFIVSIVWISILAASGITDALIFSIFGIVYSSVTAPVFGCMLYGSIRRRVRFVKPMEEEIIVLTKE